MIYLNQAATTYPKPESVQKMVERCITALPFSQYRSVADGGGTDYEGICRSCLAQLFGIKEEKRIYFTSGATQGLNTAILGFAPPENRGGIVVTATEHNSVLRPVMDGLSGALANGQRTLTVVPCGSDGMVSPAEMEKAMTEHTGLVILNHCSNVTGAAQDAKAIGELCRRKGAVFLLDASQSAGILDIDADAMNVDMMVWTGHKSLFGIQGSGGLYIRSGIPVRPIQFGGTGYDSRTLVLEEPAYETGTANLPGIAAMAAGVRFLLDTGLETVWEKDHTLMTILYEGLKAVPGVTVYAGHVPEGTALAFNIDGLSPADAGYILAGSYGILVRTGLHCAPLIHSCIGSGDMGCIRASVSWFNTQEEAEALVTAVKELSIAVG